MASDDTEFLELLLDHGLGRGDGGPWRHLLPDEHQTPTEIAAEALQHAAEVGLVRRTRLLLARGVDPNAAGTHPGYQGRRPYEGAVLHGNLEIAALLEAAGADPTAGPLTRFVGFCLAGDRAAAQEAIAEDPALLPQALDDRPDLVARAAEMDRPDAIRLLVDLGFDVNARRRTTALHEAALRGRLSVVALLVNLGADPTILDESYESTPSGGRSTTARRPWSTTWEVLPRDDHSDAWFRGSRGRRYRRSCDRSGGRRCHAPDLPQPPADRGQAGESRTRFPAPVVRRVGPRS